MVLCLLMIFDAAVVIAEILLDLHAMRSKSTRYVLTASSLKDCFTAVKIVKFRI